MHASLCSSRAPSTPALNKTLVKPNLNNSGSNLDVSKIAAVAFLAASALVVAPLAAAGLIIL